jgi:plastocyanin
MRSMLDRWPYILSVALMTLALGACSRGASKQEAPAAGGAVVTVVATDFAFALDPPLRAGTVTFALRNDGLAPHDFALRGAGVDRKTPAIQRGQTASLTVDLTPGTYTYLCSIPGHDRLGLQGSFTVS